MMRKNFVQTYLLIDETLPTVHYWKTFLVVELLRAEAQINANGEVSKFRPVVTERSVEVCKKKKYCTTTESSNEIIYDSKGWTCSRLLSLRNAEDDVVENTMFMPESYVGFFQLLSVHQFHLRY